MSNDTIRVMLVDDHNLFREGLVSMLSMQDHIEVVAEADGGADAVALAQEHKPEIVLLDLHMPEIGGIETCRRIRAALPDVKVVMLTISKDLLSLYEALKAGACGYLVKDIRLPDLIAAIDKVHETGGLPESLSDRVIQQVQSQSKEEARALAAQKALSRLSSRELQILKLITAGKGNREIAQDLIISEHTVRNHINSIFNKLQVSDRTEAAVLAIRHGVA